MRLLSLSVVAWHLICVFYSISFQRFLLRLSSRKALSSSSICLMRGIANSKVYHVSSFFAFLPRFSYDFISLDSLIEYEDLERLTYFQISSSMKLQIKDSTSFWWVYGTTSFCTNSRIFFCRLPITGSDQSFSLNVFLHLQLKHYQISVRCVSSANSTTLLSLLSLSSSEIWLINTFTFRSAPTTIFSNFSNSSRFFMLTVSLLDIALRLIERKDSFLLLLIFSLRKGSSFSCLRTRLLNCRTD